MDYILGKIISWQQNVKQLSSLPIKDATFSELTLLIRNVKESNQVDIKIVERCIREKAFHENTAAQLKIQLTQLQEQQNESVLAAIPLFQQLMTNCQNTNKQRVNN
jgi:hypothetical protein